MYIYIYKAQLVVKKSEHKNQRIKERIKEICGKRGGAVNLFLMANQLTKQNLIYFEIFDCIHNYILFHFTFLFIYDHFLPL